MGKIKIYTLLKIILAFIFVVFLFLALGAVIIYNSKSDSRLFRLASKLPYPAVLVDKKDIITISEVKNGLYSVKNFYENQDFTETGLRVDFTTAEGKKRLMILERKVLNKLTENAVIEILAKNRGIVVTDDEISQSVEDRALEKYRN